jgi:predicted amidohydrolase
MKTLTVSILQTIVEDDPASNIEKFRTMARRIDGATNIFLLPELWTGSRGAEGSDAALREVRRVCAELGSYAVAGTMPWPSDGGLVNRAWVVNDAGAAFAFYDKVHLFSLGGEDKLFRPGNVPLIFEAWGVQCSVAVCYDMWFPEYARSIGLAGGRAIFVPAQWPRQRRGSWDLLARSSAATSQTYVVSCSAAASGDGRFFGSSLVASPWGDVLASLGEEEGVLTFELDLGEIHKCRKHLSLESDRRPDLYKLLAH